MAAALGYAVRHVTAADSSPRLVGPAARVRSRVTIRAALRKTER